MLVIDLNIGAEFHHALTLCHSHNKQQRTGGVNKSFGRRLSSVQFAGSECQEEKKTPGHRVGGGFHPVNGSQSIRNASEPFICFWLLF